MAQFGYRTLGFGGGASGPGFLVASGGDSVVEDGDYKTHIFTGPGTFTVEGLAKDPANDIVDYLVVAGAGGRGFSNSGGVGAGGYRESKAPGAPWTASPIASSTSLTVTATGYAVTVGAGGASNVQGGSSTFSSIVSAGGGYGGGANPGSCQTGGPGGSGGGGGGYPTGHGCGGGSGNQPPTSPAQGYGGAKYAGGGATQAGTGGGWSPGTKGGDGTGTGIQDGYPGTPVIGQPGPSAPLRYYSNGGGVTAGGGGNPGTANSGSGGPNAQTGASGIVIVKYKFQ